MTGELDHDRVVCANEHEIRQEGDVVPAAYVEMNEIQATLNRLEVLRNYGQPQPIDPELYGKKDFEGF